MADIKSASERLVEDGRGGGGAPRSRGAEGRPLTVSSQITLRTIHNTLHCLGLHADAVYHRI